MEPGVRVKTNHEGFCAAHLRKLHAGENRLGLGLVIHTRLQLLESELGDALEAASRRAGRRDSMKAAERVAGTLESVGRSCYLCRMLDRDLQRYAFTILYLWARDPGFPAGVSRLPRLLSPTLRRRAPRGPAWHAGGSACSLARGGRPSAPGEPSAPRRGPGLVHPAPPCGKPQPGHGGGTDGPLSHAAEARRGNRLERLAAADLGNDGQEIRRQRRLDHHRSARHGVGKGDTPGMQAVP